MENIKSSPEENQEAIAEAVRLLEYYDTHPTEVPELFINQAMLRRLVQMSQYKLPQMARMANGLKRVLRYAKSFGPVDEMREIVHICERALCINDSQK